MSLIGDVSTGLDDQMLCQRIEDLQGIECGGLEEGLNLLPVDTVLGGRKVRSEFKGSVVGATGSLSALKGLAVEGYEIHMGITKLASEGYANADADSKESLIEFTSNKTGYSKGNVYGTYVHGFFDKKEIMETVTGKKADEAKDFMEFKQTQYDILEKGLRESLDMKYIYEIMGIKR